MRGPIPARWAPYLQSVLRIVAAVPFMTHGTQKLFAIPVVEPREPALLHLTAAGPGPWSLDALRRGAGARP